MGGAPCAWSVEWNKAAADGYYTPAQEERTRPDTKTPPRTLASAKKNQKKKQELKDNQSAQMPRQ